MKTKYFRDKELVELVRKDDSIAFKYLHEKYSGKMFLYAFSVIKNKEVCEDIIQNIFVNIWSKRKEVKVADIKSYLFRAVKYQIFNYFRDRKIPMEDITRLNIVDMSIDASKKMEYHELEEVILTSVNKLPKRCKYIFELSRFEHKSNKEISIELKISI
jgi:RNA polymerase sigma-70 factor (ECF subfamily)